MLSKFVIPKYFTGKNDEKKFFSFNFFVYQSFQDKMTLMFKLSDKNPEGGGVSKFLPKSLGVNAFWAKSHRGELFFIKK